MAAIRRIGQDQDGINRPSRPGTFGHYRSLSAFRRRILNERMADIRDVVMRLTSYLSEALKDWSSRRTDYRGCRRATSQSSRHACSKPVHGVSPKLAD
jgi:hypothetical protein